MDELLAMKGKSTLLARVKSIYGLVELHGYADGSYSIARDHRPFGVWEAAEQKECVDTFLGLIRVRKSHRTIWVIRQRESRPALRCSTSMN